MLELWFIVNTCHMILRHSCHAFFGGLGCFGHVFVKVQEVSELELKVSDVISVL